LAVENFGLGLQVGLDPLADHEDAASVVRRQGDKLDDSYVLHWLGQFEHALDDSTLVAEYTRLRAGKR